jgi:hypothetical protein
LIGFAIVIGPVLWFVLVRGSPGPASSLSQEGALWSADEAKAALADGLYQDQVRLFENLDNAARASLIQQNLAPARPAVAQWTAVYAGRNAWSITTDNAVYVVFEAARPFVLVRRIGTTPEPARLASATVEATPARAAPTPSAVAATPTPPGPVAASPIPSTQVPAPTARVTRTPAATAAVEDALASRFRVGERVGFDMWAIGYEALSDCKPAGPTKSYHLPQELATLVAVDRCEGQFVRVRGDDNLAWWVLTSHVIKPGS